jgi:NADPH:quinone reductase-like Zn-dependent oxidoreductase
VLEGWAGTRRTGKVWVRWNDGADPMRRMLAVVTLGIGGDDQLAWTEAPLPHPGPGEVLLQVLAAGVNNTDINTRLGWYASSTVTGTNEAAALPHATSEGGGWKGATAFPLIQGADCCGRIVAVGKGGDESQIGARALVRPCMRQGGLGSRETLWMGSDFDGAFAQFVKVPTGEVFPIRSHWSDAELATIPCAYGTAENMLERAGVATGGRVLVTGASGGVGSATVQLAKRRGAIVTAVTTAAKQAALWSLNADHVVDREQDLVSALGEESVDVVIDNVGGAGFGSLLAVLRRGGTYVSSGAVAGPLVSLDLRRMYLKDLTLLGCTTWDEPVFPNVVSYVERDEIRPLLAGTYPLSAIAAAQRDFLQKNHVGKLVLIPPPPTSPAASTDLDP